MKSDIPHIKNPCPKSWTNMEGNFEKRFCETCNLNVYNLSEMSTVSRKELLASDRPLCVTYYMDSDGTPFSFQDLPWPERFLKRLRVALMEGLIFRSPPCSPFCGAGNNDA